VKEKSTLELGRRLNQIRVEVQKLWIEHNQIIEELHNRLPHLKNDADMQPKKRVRKYEDNRFIK
jgi:hypothetical protein